MLRGLEAALYLNCVPKDKQRTADLNIYNLGNTQESSNTVATMTDEQISKIADAVISKLNGKPTTQPDAQPTTQPDAQPTTQPDEQPDAQSDSNDDKPDGFVE